MSDVPNDPSKAPAAPSDKAAETAKAPAAEKAAAAPATPAAKPAAAEKPPEPPPEPGKYGKMLEAAKIPVQHLGADAAGKEAVGFAHADVLRACEYLRNQAKFDLLLSCSGVDWKTHRESVYHLYSTETHEYLALKIQADENDHSPSLMPVWPAVDWHERETYDLFGIHYDGHPNLQRILMPIDWLGHPMRKDYKVDDPRLVWNER